ncbi:efflux RND transporter periplasmic adaptor subunit [Candidatus Kaiserbacteria bacterium]|nr:efflux RND transporter periplasmic adaptor subunit [Candidatus Kaiserbacteria bacterium]
MNRSILIGSVVGIMIAIMAGAAYYVNASQTQNSFVPEIVAYRRLAASVSISGETKAADTVDLAFKNGGIVDLLPVVVGDSVATNTTLAILQRTTLTNRLAQVRATLEAERARLRDLKNGVRLEQIAVTQARLASGETALANAVQGLLDALRAAQSASDIAVRFTIDQFVQNPSMTNSGLTIPASDTQLGLRVLAERRRIDVDLSSWSARILALPGMSAGDLLSASAGMHAYLQTVSEILDGLTRLLAAGGPAQSASGQTAIASARTSVTSANNALTAADQSVLSAQAAVAVAQNQLALEKAGSTSETIAAQQAVVWNVSAQVAEFEDEIRDQSIVAPFGGVVTAVNAKPRETVEAGMPVVSLISDGALKIEGYVPEIHYAEIAVGQSVAIELDAFPGVSFDGTLGLIDPAATLRSGVPNFKVTAYFVHADPRIRPGLTARAFIRTGDKPHALSVPIAAVTGAGDDASVLRLVGSNAVRTRVALGVHSVDGYVEIVSGLSEGDIVLVNGTKQYRIIPN